MKFALSILCLTLFSASLLAAPRANCGLPVCDINKKIKELRAETQDNRVAFYVELISKYKTNKDSAVLENLIDFSLKAYDLSMELDASEPWITAAPAELLNRSLSSILVQNPIQVQKYVRWYGLFNSESASSYRFQILQFWGNQLKLGKIVSVNDYKLIIAFMRLAKVESERLQDEVYVGNLAETIATQAGLELLRLSPYFEGVYKIRVTCETKLANVCPKISIFSLVLGDDWRQIQAAFIDPSLTDPVFEFNEVKFVSETEIEGETGPLDVPLAPGSFKIKFDVMKKTLTGTIRTPRTQNEITVTGELVESPNSLYLAQAPSSFPSMDQIEGLYRGEIQRSAQNPALTPVAPAINLKVLRYQDQTFKATLRDSRTEEKILDFPVGYYFENVGVMTFYAGDENGLLKYTFAYRLVQGKPRWIGLAHSLRTGQYYHINLNAK